MYIESYTHICSISIQLAFRNCFCLCRNRCIPDILYYPIQCYGIYLSSNRHIQTSWPQHPKFLYKNYLIYTHDNSLIWSNICCWFSFYFQEDLLPYQRQWGKLKCGSFEPTGIFHFLVHDYQMLTLNSSVLALLEPLACLICSPCVLLPRIIFKATPSGLSSTVPPIAAAPWGQVCACPRGLR